MNSVPPHCVAEHLTRDEMRADAERIDLVALLSQ